MMSDERLQCRLAITMFLPISKGRNLEPQRLLQRAYQAVPFHQNMFVKDSPILEKKT